MFSQKIFLFVCFAAVAFSLPAQNNAPVKFGQVDVSDFNLPQSSAIDSSDGAVIIAEVGSTTFQGNSKGWFNHTLTVHRRIQILKKTAFDIGTVKILLYSDDDRKETVRNIVATTYNVENGKVVSQKIGKGDVFENRLNKNYTEKKFTLPAIKEGSIIEYSYSLESEFDFRLPSWQFQDDHYPCLWSEYKVSIPALLNYEMLKQGNDQFYTKELTSESVNYKVQQDIYGSLPQILNINTYNAIYHWIMKDVRPLAEENYLSTIDNYVDRLDFQLKSWSSDGQDQNMFRSSWKDVSKELLSYDFADILSFSASTNKDWYKSNIDENIKKDADTLQAAKQIYYVVQKNFNSTGGDWYVEKKLNQLLQTHAANAAEINLFLVAVLRTKGINAAPLILSTREHGFLYDDYPMLDRVNYLVCKVSINGNVYFLDASVPKLGFGILPYKCYNGYARVVDSYHPDSVYLTSNNLHEQNIINCSLSSNEGGSFDGVLTSKLGTYESLDLRTELKNETVDDYKKQFKFSQEGLSVNNFSADSLDDLESGISLKFNLDMKLNNENVLYFTPVILPSYNTNPFLPTNRLYPVEMPYCTDNLYVLDMTIPKGYEVDQLPKSVKTSLDQNGGSFEYVIQQSGDHIQLRCHTILNKAVFEPGDYATLRNFFALIIQKENEQIAFKKI